MGSRGELESLAVDDELGYLYGSEESVGVHKYHADANHPDAGKRLALFGRDKFIKDREGIGIYCQPGGKGYIVVSDQGDGESQVHLYRREGKPGAPHDHSELVAEISGGADTTDGLDVSSVPLGRFGGGLLVSMNSKGKNFLLYDWKGITGALKPNR